MRERVLVHGATGFTGKLVCEALRKRGISFAIAGRSQEKLDALSRALGGVETSVIDVRSSDTIKAALEGRTVVCACAGPFVDVGEPILASCARMGIHYADTTGEQLFVSQAVSRYRATAEASGACVVPSMAYEIAPADWGAHAAAKRLGGAPDDISILYMSNAKVTTRGTKQSALRVIAAGDAKQFIEGALRLELAGAIVKGFSARSGRRVTGLSFPSPEPVVVSSHTGANNVRTFMAMGKGTARVLSVSRGALPALATVGNRVLSRLIARSTGGPEGEDRDATFEILIEARRGTSCVRAFVTGRDPYGLTAEIQAVYAERALAGQLGARGVVAPSEAIAPADALLALPDLALHVEG
ncbi:MAG: saccharopine dehydrogenase NADP-binding domain-containing protein [Polyangiaceae bacterium]